LVHLLNFSIFQLLGAEILPFDHITRAVAHVASGSKKTRALVESQVSITLGLPLLL
jgi:hypothetical protein